MKCWGMQVEVEIALVVDIEVVPGMTRSAVGLGEQRDVVQLFSISMS